MGGILGKLVSGPLSDLFGKVAAVIDNVHTSGEEKLAAQRELLKLQADFQIRMAEIDAEYAKTQASVIEAEVNSESWMARNWRPITMLTFTFIVAFNYIIAPMFGLSLLAMPIHLWDLLQIGMGGYVFGRTAEKVIPTIAEAVVTARTNSNNSNSK